ncbi:MAG: LPS assembly protein LptD [Pseudomonadota bacterium]
MGDDLPTLMSADEMIYDEALDIITARGNVEISQDERVLLADVVSYNANTGVVTASGDVTLLEPGGEILFADFVELKEDLSEGVIRQIKVLLTDQSRLAAANARRSEDNYTVFNRGVFSPCKLCRDNPESPPLWQLKAAEVVHDQEDKTIEYRDAWMEIFGVPVIYTPYFSHPDPTVKRKSGFLAPSIGGSSFLGTTVQVPYFWAISNDKDLTFEPIFTTKQGIVAAGQYRQLLPYGEIDVRATGTIGDREASDGTIEKDKFRGNIDAVSRFEFSDNWRGGLDINRASDDTYLRRYDLSAASTLTSQAFAEGFWGRDYASVNNFAYQGLRSRVDSNELPIITPLADYNYISEPGIAGGVYSLDSNLMVLSRIEGRDSRRLSLTNRYEIPYTGAWGDIYKVTAQLQTDGYFTDGVEAGSDDFNPDNPGGSNLTGRAFPQLAVNWRYPWIQENPSWQQVIEPVAQIVLAPNGSNPGEIPNEDSLQVEFDENNLFSLNRFPGLDRVDSGSRIDYGLNWGATFAGGRSIDTFIGQSFRFIDEQTAFDENTGLRSQLSDIVGRVHVNPFKDVDLLYRFRFDEKDFQAQRNELALDLGPSALNLDLNYTFLVGDSNNDRFDDREEVTVRLSSQLNNNWSVFAQTRRDLVDDATLSTRFGVTYEDECFLVEGVIWRNFFQDRDLQPEDAFFVRVVFTHLGEISTR